jgi:HK97 family phage major capsid protein
MTEIDMKAAALAVDKLNFAWEAQKATIAELASEVKSLGGERPETKAKFEKIEADLEAAQKISEEAVLAVKRMQRAGVDQGNGAVDLDQRAADWANEIAAKRGNRVEGFDAKAMTAYKAAFDDFIRKDEKILSADSAKALSVGSDPDGGYFVTPDMSGRIVKKVYETSAIRAYASVQQISGAELRGTYDNNEASTFWEGETETPSEGATPKIGEWRFPLNEMRTIVKASQQLIDDAYVSIESWLMDKVAQKISRSENVAFVSGGGVGRPRGFLTYPDGSDLTNSITRYKTGVNGAFAAAPNGADVLINALYGLKGDYRANANWFMNRSTMAKVRLLKNTDGSMLWQPGIAAGQPSTLLGYGIASFEDMPDAATGSLSIAVGDMREAYQIAEKGGLSILRDPYSYKPFVGFYCRKRVGGMLVNGDALKLVEFSA